MAAPKEILDLVARFEQQLDSYKFGNYNETQLRREFLDPFFKALGWDIDNNAGYAEAYKDVIHEDAIKIGEATKAPDYCFRIGGTRKFFLEAKKPSVVIKDQPEPAFQLRRYAWTSKLPLSILSDFEEFAVYDCRIKPDQNDKASKARIQYFTFRDYAEKWDEIASVFSRDAILKGSFDRYAETTKGKRGTADVDDAFLETIEKWRSELAKDLARKNPAISQRELNFSVQRIIDRIIFLRICEGRGIEDYGRLQALINGDRVYPRLCELFQQADDRYNSGIFHFKPEKGRHEPPDELTLNLNVDDKLLKTILKSLYYPESPYVFSALPADILGQVYEQFLGKVIRLTESHNAIVEEKPEVKKAGGVYYTPTYIVEYIVQNTVGKLINGIITTCGNRREEALTKPAAPRKKKSDSTEPHLDLAVDPAPPSPLGGERVGVRGDSFPRDVITRVAKLRILDPACGSGSFLLGAYDFLLNWHLKFYTENNPEYWAKAERKRQPAIVQASGSGKGEWRLTINERKRILLANIYGVDIDAQAVETTKLSLLLKVLEGETQQSLQPFFRTFHERALPDLGDNIKCGNSLIGPDFYNQPEMNLLSEDERYRINVFDWLAGFPNVFDAGGFDAVIGNPPYGAYLYKQDKSYLEANYSAQSYQLDTYLLFLERAFTLLLREEGYYGMIIPNPWLTNLLQQAVRRFVFQKTCVQEIVHFKFPVFPKVVVDTEIVLLRNKCSPAWAANVVVAHTKDAFTARPWPTGVTRLAHSQQKWRNLDGGPVNIFTTDREELLAAKCLKKSVPLESLCAINVGIKPYQVGKGNPPQTKRIVEERPFDSNVRIDPSYRQCLRGTDLTRFQIKPAKQLFLRYGPWLAEPRPAANFDASSKILVRQTGDSLIAALDQERRLCMNNVHVLVPFDTAPSPYYLLGIIDSKLINWYYTILNPEVGEALAEVKKTHVASLPIRLPPNSFFASVLSQHVEKIIDLKNRELTARTPQEKTSLERQIAATDAQIDRLVYELYDLTPEEIAIVEGRTSQSDQQSADSKAAIADTPEPTSTAQSTPPGPTPNPEKSWADSAHFYSAKEEAPPYIANPDSQKEIQP